MQTGYWGKVLCIDLSSGNIRIEEPPERVYRQYLGGTGLGVHYLYERIPAGADPFGPENILAFLPGLLTGSGAQFGGRFLVAGKSPLTGGWGEANCGGNFGPALHGAGCDALLISGVSEKPVYIFIEDGKAEIRPADEVWGLDTVQSEAQLRLLTANDARVACIGPAGEQRSLIAGIVNDDGRIAARSGLGAVMGAKRLKAVVARGKKRPALADERRFKAASAAYLPVFRRKATRLQRLLLRWIKHLAPVMRRFKFEASMGEGASDLLVESFRRYGTVALTAVAVEMGDTPVKNWSGIGYRDFPLSSSLKLSDEQAIRFQKRVYACHSCPLACGGRVELETGEQDHRIEYETASAFGALSLVDDLEIIQRCNLICNQAGLDTISTGVCAAFAIECAERGWLPTELANELPLKWGDGQTLLALVERIGERRPGLGEWLADGVKRAAARLGEEAQQAAMHAGGQELPMHRGLFSPGLALSYQTDPAPGRHTLSLSGELALPAVRPFADLRSLAPSKRYAYEAKGKAVALTSALARAYDALGLCQFAIQTSKPPFLEWLNAATGWEVTPEEFLQTGERIQTMRHAFNARQGLPAQFPLPGRERGDPPQSDGPTAGVTLDMQTMAAAYFAALGVDAESGWPQAETIERLELSL